MKPEGRISGAHQGEPRAVAVLREVLRPPSPLGAEPDPGPVSGPSPILGSYLGRYQEGLLVVAPDGRFRLFTAGLERITGYSAAEVPSVTEALRLLCPDEEDAQSLRALLDAAYTGPDPGERLVRVRDRAGQPHWLRASVHRVNEDAVVHVLDISAVHRVGTTASAGDDPCRELLESIDVGVWAMDGPTAARITFLNAAARRILGLDPRWASGSAQDVFVFEDPADRVRLMRALLADRFTRSRTVRIETRLLRSGDRQPVDTCLTATASYDEQGRTSRVVGTLEDLGAHRSAEMRRQRSELLLHSLFEGAAVGVVLGSLEGHFRAANPAFCRMVGYPEVELLGRNVDDLVHPDERGMSGRAIQQALAEGRVTVSYPRRYLHRDGHVVPCEATLVAVLDAQGQPVAGIGLVRPTGTA